MSSIPLSFDDEWVSYFYPWFSFSRCSQCHDLNANVIIYIVHFQMYTMTVIACSPYIIVVPREEAVRKAIIGFMKRFGFSMCFDKKRDFVSVTKNVPVPAYILIGALEAAGLEEVS